MTCSAQDGMGCSHSEVELCCDREESFSVDDL